MHNVVKKVETFFLLKCFLVLERSKFVKNKNSKKV